MSYHIYTTDGIVLKRLQFGESNSVLYILSRELGLIIVSAQAVRAQLSKLRPSIQEFSYGSFSCVKGKGGWKLVNARSQKNYYFETDSLPMRQVMARISALLIQMIPGEAVHMEVFDTMLSAYDACLTLPTEHSRAIEVLAVLRILYHLGYVVSDGETGIYVSSGLQWDTDTLISVERDMKSLVAIINNSIKASQL